MAAGSAEESRANGRPPATTNVAFEPGNAQTIYLPVTFGFLKSTDDGETFQWLCEAAVGYGGIFDPDYAVSPEGDIYATTFDGLRMSRDGGCNFETLREGLPADKFVSEVEIGPDGRVWVPTSSGQGDNDMFVADDGTTFTSTGLFDERIWWISVRTTAADPNRVYVTGYLPSNEETKAPPEAILRRSINGGKTWEELSVDDFDFDTRRDVILLGASPVDEDIVFARVVGAVDRFGDALYRSADGGASWQNVAEFGDAISAFLIRPDGQTIIAGTINGCPGDKEPTAKGCVRISEDAGATWELAEQQPRLACLGERSDGTLFGCGANWDPDNFALGRSQDGQTWEKVYRFSETAGPVECESESPQAQCAAEIWPGLCIMFGICPTVDAGVDPPDAGNPGEDKGGGDEGCGIGGDGTWISALLMALGLLAWRRRS
jgi:hypothetical protein